MVMTRSARKKLAAREADAFAGLESMLDAGTTTMTPTMSPMAATIIDEHTSSTNSIGDDTGEKDDIFVPRGLFPSKRKGDSKQSDGTGGTDDKWETLSIPNIESASTTSTTSPMASSSSSIEVAAVEDPRDSVRSVSNNIFVVSPSASSTMTQASSLPDSDQLLRNEEHLDDDDDDERMLNDGQRDAYISKEDLVLLLPTDSYEDYMTMVHQEQKQAHSDRQLRKKLIHEELSALLRRMHENEQMEDGPELEPEAEEALGIASNRICYRQKYYDVATCQDIFVPSVAYAIMNGSLLEEAINHYYGKSDEFLVTYAAALGSAVLSMKNHASLTNIGVPTNHTPKEGQDLAVGQQRPSLKNETVSDLFLGVASPRNHSPDHLNIFSSDASSKEKMKQKVKLAIGLYAILAIFFFSVVLVLQPDIEAGTVEILVQEKPEVSWSDPVLLPRSLVVPQDVTPKVPRVVERSLAKIETGQVSEPLQKAVKTDLIITNKKEQESPPSKSRSKRPIAFNLLYS